jgi:hypothetical protein
MIIAELFRWSLANMWVSLLQTHALFVQLLKDFPGEQSKRSTVHARLSSCEGLCNEQIFRISIHTTCQKKNNDQKPIFPQQTFKAEYVLPLLVGPTCKYIRRFNRRASGNQVCGCVMSARFTGAGNSGKIICIESNIDFMVACNVLSRVFGSLSHL